MVFFHIFWIVLVFFAWCSQARWEPSRSELLVSTDSENMSRCDTYLDMRTHEISNYTWTIEHFSRYEENRTKEISSPSLRAPTHDEHYWKININPNDEEPGTLKPRSISLCIHLYHNPHGFAETNISILNRKGEAFVSINTTYMKINFNNNPRCWRQLCLKDDLFRDQVLQNDTLTFSISIRWFYEAFHNISHRSYEHSSSNLTHDRSSTTIIKCNPFDNNFAWMLENPEYVDFLFETKASNNYRCDVYVQVHEIKYIWTVHNFSLHETRGTANIYSPLLQASTTNRYEWYVKITPNGHYSLSEYENFIGLDVCLSDRNEIKEAWAKYNVSIINGVNKVLHYRNSSVEKFKAEESEYWADFCEKNSCFRNHLLEDDTLTLLIHIKWISELPQNVSNQHMISLPSSSIKSNLTKYLESMLENRNLADVMFATNTTEYPAHKFILAARSSVFAAVFQEKEKKHGKNKQIRINVAHINEQVLRTMLRYIYTEKCENFEKIADELLVAAAKFGLNGLKRICEQTLCKTLSTENAAKMLQFAEKHNANELKFKAEELLKTTHQN